MLENLLFVWLKSRNRKRCTVTLGILVVCSLAFSVLLPAVNGDSAADDWSMYHLDSAHTGYSTATAPTTLPKQLWNYTIDISPSSTSPSPVVADGFLYVSSFDNNIYCLDAARGTEVWTFETEYIAGSSPAVGDGYVYAGSGDGNVYCLDASKGTQIWNFSIRGPADDSAASPITLANNRVFVESWSGHVFCLDAANGSMIWNYSTGCKVSNSYACSPAVFGNTVYVGNSNGAVICLDASNGTKLWNYTTGGAVRSPAVTGGYVYVGSADGNAYCLNASSGDKIWNYTTEFNSNGPSHGYYWGNTVSDPAVANGRVYVGSSNFGIYCLDAINGSKIWNFTTNAEVYASPVVVGGCVFAGSYDGNVYCLNATNGSSLWSYAAGTYSPVNAGGSAGSPIVAGGVVYLVGNGVVYALGTAVKSSSTFPIILIVGVIAVLVVVVVVLALVYHKVL
jgi:outer membrane protein assembly factor BamB